LVRLVGSTLLRLSSDAVIITTTVLRSYYYDIREVNVLEELGEADDSPHSPERSAPRRSPVRLDAFTPPDVPLLLSWIESRDGLTRWAGFVREGHLRETTNAPSRLWTPHVMSLPETDPLAKVPT
jgi:hypothetical protein